MRNEHNNVFSSSAMIILLCAVFTIIGGRLCAQTNVDSILNKIDPEKLSASVERKATKLEVK